MAIGIAGRMSWTSAVLALSFFAAVSASGTWYQRYVNFYNVTLRNDPHLQKLWKQHLKEYTGYSKRANTRYPVPPFDCPTAFPWSGREPTSVHQLHPGDVDVVAAIGDSLTAGNGVDADNILQDLIEYRGLSWSGGGDGTLDDGILTLPNILKKYNNGISGYAVGTGGNTGSGAGLNVADPGDTSFDMPAQARMLVDRMKATTDFQRDWKVITLFVGGNDLCDACNDWARYRPENYADNIRQALDIFHAEVPRALVNVALIFDIAPVAQLSSNNIWCTLVHALVCACGQNSANALRLRELAHGYQNATENLIRGGRYDTRDDFTVVIQPFFKNTEPPVQANDPNTVDMSYFSADCFHFSGKGQGAAGLSLWNNMCEAVGHKQEDWHLDQPFRCPGSHIPGDHFFFQTKKNGNL